VDDSVQFYWELIAQDTICSNAKLHFSRKPAILFCLSCGKEFEIDKELIDCPDCGGHQSKVSSGNEFFVDSIEVRK
jgi:hydrogenase nickel incorporation protein HypA/HybF